MARFTNVSFVVIAFFIVLIVTYRFFGSDKYGNLFHAEHLWDSPQEFQSEHLSCALAEKDIVPKFWNFEEIFKNRYSSPLLFPFPKVAYSDPNGPSKVLILSDNFVIATDADRKDDLTDNLSTLSTLASKRFCEKANKFHSILSFPSLFDNSFKTHFHVVNEININISNRSYDLSPKHRSNKPKNRNRILNEIIIDNSLVIQHEHEEFYEIIIHSTAISNNNNNVNSNSRNENKNNSKSDLNQRNPTNATVNQHNLNFVTVKIYCNSNKGVVLALATLSQLLTSPAPLALPFTLLDWPDNNWRGILIDVSRHFQPVSLLKRTIDVMETSKLNILHLHLTDAQSFPLLLDDVWVPNWELSDGVIDNANSIVNGVRQSDTNTDNNKNNTHNDNLKLLKLSDLALKSSFDASNSNPNNIKIYTKNDIKELIQYAKERNIEIVPEIDMPAHAYSWNKAFNDIVIICKNTASRSQTPNNIYPLDPSRKLTLILIKEIIKQIHTLFNSNYIHIGGDEVDEKCYSESSAVREWSKNNNISMNKITKYFETEIVNFVYGLGKIPIIWQGVLDEHNMPEQHTYNGSYKTYDQRNSGGSGGSSGSSVNVNTVHNIIYSNNNNTTDTTDTKYTTKQSISRKLTTKSATKTTAKSTTPSNKGSQKAPRKASQKVPPVVEPLPSQPVIEPWKCWDGVALRSAVTAVDSGYPVIMSACWYLDYNQDWTTYLAADQAATSRIMSKPYLEEAQRRKEKQGGGADSGTYNTLLNTVNNVFYGVRKRFSYQPGGTLKELSQEQENLLAENKIVSTQDLFLGGEGAYWTENIDHTNFECRLHPRLGAVAARLWGLGSQFISTSYEHKYTTDNNNNTTSSQTNANNANSNGNTLRANTAGTSSPLPNIRFIRNPGHQNMYLSLIQTKLLYGSFAHYRFYLSTVLSVKAAELTFHYPKQVTMGTSGGYDVKVTTNAYSEPVNNEIEALRRISLLEQPVNISTNDKLFANIEPGTFRITAQCPKIPEPVQRPLQTNVIKALQMNIENGGGLGDGYKTTRGTKLQEWLLTKASEGVLFIGFNELNSWNDYEASATTELVKNKPKIVFNAANSGFIYSYIMTSPSHSYHIGLTSAVPFVVVQEYKPPQFQRGVLHVYYAQMSLHVFIIHLHASSSVARVEECMKIAEILKPLVDKKEKVMLMGDFNTLSPFDQRQHDAEELTKMFQRTDQSVFQHWGNKFLTADKKAINYEPMEIILRSGMKDSCVERCKLQATTELNLNTHQNAAHHHNSNKTSTTDTIAATKEYIAQHQWSLNSTTVTDSKSGSFSECMRDHCSYSEPTQYNPEWPFKDLAHPKIRLDYILVSDAVLASGTTALNDTNVEKAPPKVEKLIPKDEKVGQKSTFNARLERNNVTSVLSDHYPVYIEWTDYSLQQDILFYRRN